MVPPAWICSLFQSSASRTSSYIRFDPSDESLGYFQSSANADWAVIAFVHRRAVPVNKVPGKGYLVYVLWGN